nr:hypothetical protein [Tanacetum cinerariifolium]
KRDAIELKNLLIANDNLIAECLSQEVFGVATNSELNVARFTEIYVANTTAEARCLALKAELANLHSQITKLTDQVTHLQAQNDLFRAENDKIKQHCKELYESIKITRAKHIEQVTKLTTENVNMKTSVSKDTVNHQVSTRDKHTIDVEPIVPRLRNNRDAHLYYLRHLKESVETICDIIEEAKVVRPRDRSIVSAGRYTKHSQELLEYTIGTCPQGSQQRAKQLAHIPLIRKKISSAKDINKLPVEDQPRTNKSHLRTSNHVASNSRLKRTVINSNLDSMCQTCNKCLTSSNHDMSVATCLQSVVATTFIRYNCSAERKVKVVANQLDLVSHKFVTQLMTTTLSIEIDSLIEGESNFEIYDTNQASQNKEQSSEKILISNGIMV